MQGNEPKSGNGAQGDHGSGAPGWHPRPRRFRHHLGGRHGEEGRRFLHQLGPTDPAAVPQRRMLGSSNSHRPTNRRWVGHRDSLRRTSGADIRQRLRRQLRSATSVRRVDQGSTPPPKATAAKRPTTAAAIPKAADGTTTAGTPTTAQRCRRQPGPLLLPSPFR